MNLIRIAAGLPRRLPDIRNTSLTTRTAVVVALIGLSVWLLLDLVYQQSAQRDLSARLQQQLHTAAVTERGRIHKSLASFRATARYLAWELMPVLERGLAGAGGEPFSIWRASLARLRGHALVHDTVYRLLLLGRLLRYRHAASADAAVALLEAARESVRHQLGQDGVILLPTLGLLAPRHGVMNRLSLRPGANPLLTPVMLCNYLDLPAITVPAWRYRDDRSGLAPGIMLAASPGAEALLFDTAERLEEACALALDADHDLRGRAVLADDVVELDRHGVQSAIQPRAGCRLHRGRGAKRPRRPAGEWPGPNRARQGRSCAQVQARR